MEIIIVDDEPAVAVAVKSALKYYGHEVLSVSRAEDAIERIKSEPGRFDAVVTDHNMPGIGGLGLVKALRDMGFGGRVVIVSAFLGPAVEAKYGGLGVDQILAKPFDIARLRQALDSK